ncbi:cytochrome c oxidase subunit 1 [Nannocystis exedens]|uniref:Cytochrome c oxidase subunit 1 n=1 Tax=Nannocystis exedens TaxID=54 RepID=A0A1I2AQS0_9BACT|nr:cytochrome c oxidase subunit I [Nannocystis exedens]PCC74220.1 cytochrome c oxidase subunit I [Nannocystis exedens]SFE46344.1 cytochrome c oxidase subunit 1 [Nannocystis exedens]
MSDLSTEREPPNYLNAKRGLLSWLLTVDHKRIGVMYLVTTNFFFLVGGILALVLRTELFTPDQDFMSAQTYNQVFTLHGAVMTFLFIIPISATLGNFILPLMLGAKDVAFPKLNLLSYYIFALGSCFLIAAILVGGVDTGWTFYTPYSTSTGTAVTTATLGVFIAGFSSILTGLNFIVTTHKLRAPGMHWNRMPLFVWSTYATAVIQVLATPVLAITLLLLVVERTLGIGVFDPAMGGDPVLYQHFFWFYSHPAVYIMILPGFGMISELVTVHSRKHIFGYKAIALSSVAIAVISFLVWGHHMFVSGQSEVAAVLFSLLTFAVGVPTAIKVFSWLATLYKGSIQYTTPMLYALMFLWTFTIGGLTGIALSTLAMDVHLHDTYFVVAHFHYVMVGGTVVAFIGAMHHWWPKITGRMFSERAGRVGALLVFIGFNLTFMTQFFLGHQGMPRRYYAYLPEYQRMHQVSTVGSWILATGLIWILIYWLWSLRYGPRAPANPWGGVSLEWQTPSPPPEHNFDETPVVRGSPYDFPEIDKTPGERGAS